MSILESCLAQLEFRTDFAESPAVETLPLSKLVASQPNEQNEDTLLKQLSYLIHQKDKIKAGLLDESIPSSVKSKFQGLLEELEADDHSVVDVIKGSISFLVFCKHQVKWCPLPDRIDGICHELNKLCFVLGKPTLLLTKLKLLS